METAVFDRDAWRAACSNIQVRCSQRSLSPMHALFIFSQAIDDALRHYAQVHLEEAFDIAREYGYESTMERAEFVHWFTASGTHPDQSSVLARR